MTEQSLAALVVAWLEAQHWEVYQEVQPHGGGSEAADIVAVRSGLVWVIECKTTFSLAVMAQAVRWGSHLRSVAVPFGNSAERQFAEQICRQHLQVGVLYVHPMRDGLPGDVVERCPAPLMRHYHKRALWLRKQLRPEHKTSAPAGSQVAKRWTPYQETMEEVRSYLRRKGAEGATIAEIMQELGKRHYANKASARQCIPDALVRIEKEWCEVLGEGKAQRFRLRDGGGR